MPVPRRHVTILLAVVAACFFVAPASAYSTVRQVQPARRDSAGVRIIEYTANALVRAPLITMDSAPMAVIGGSDLKDDVTRVRLLVFLADGRVAAMDDDAVRKAIRIFDTGGIDVRAFGRPGEGPGEFREVVGLAWGPGDTLAVTDRSLFRVTIFHPAIGYVRDQPVKVRQSLGASYAAAGRLADGSWLMRPISWVITGSGAHEIGAPPPPVPFGRLRASTPRDGFDTLGSVPGIETAYVTKAKTGVATPRFSTPAMVVGWDGQAAVVANRTWRVERVDARGKLTTVIAIKGPRRAVTRTMIDSDIAAAVRRRLPDTSGAGAIAKLTAELREWPSKDSLPPFGEVRAGPDGILWLPDYAVPGERQVHITALGRDGTLIGRLALPANVRIEAFGPGRLLLRTTDEDGIIRFEVHRLRMPR